MARCSPRCLASPDLVSRPGGFTFSLTQPASEVRLLSALFVAIGQARKPIRGFPTSPRPRAISARTERAQLLARQRVRQLSTVFASRICPAAQNWGPQCHGAKPFSSLLGHCPLQAPFAQDHGTEEVELYVLHSPYEQSLSHEEASSSQGHAWSPHQAAAAVRRQPRHRSTQQGHSSSHSQHSASPAATGDTPVHVANGVVVLPPPLSHHAQPQADAFPRPSQPSHTQPAAGEQSPQGHASTSSADAVAEQQPTRGKRTSRIAQRRAERAAGVQRAPAHSTGPTESQQGPWQAPGEQATAQAALPAHTPQHTLSPQAPAMPSHARPATPESQQALAQGSSHEPHAVGLRPEQGDGPTGHHPQSDASAHSQPHPATQQHSSTTHFRPPHRRGPGRPPAESQPQLSQERIQQLEQLTQLQAGLTMQIVTAQSAGELHNALMSRECDLNPIHVSAALRQLVKFAGDVSRQAQYAQWPPQDASPAQPAAAGADGPQQPPRELRPPPSAEHVLLRQMTGSLGQVAVQQLKEMRARELTCIMASLVRLRAPFKKDFYIRFMVRAQKKSVLNQMTVQVRVCTCRLYVCVCAACAAACRGPFVWQLQLLLPCDRASVASCTCKLRTVVGHADLASSYCVLCVFASLAMHTQGLAQLLWAIARSGMQGLRPDYGATMCAAIAQRWPELTARGAIRILHSLALLRYRPDESWLLQLLQPIQAELATATPRDVCMTFWSLARLRWAVELPEPFLAALLGRAEQLWPALSEGEAATVLWSVARLEARPSQRWQARALMQVNRHIPRIRSSWTLAFTCYALGLLGWRADPRLLTPALDQLQRARFRGLSLQGLAMLVDGLARGGHRPDAAWLEAAQARLVALGAQRHLVVQEMLAYAYSAFALGSPSSTHHHTSPSYTHTHHPSAYPTPYYIAQQQQQQQSHTPLHHAHSSSSTTPSGMHALSAVAAAAAQPPAVYANGHHVARTPGGGEDLEQHGVPEAAGSDTHVHVNGSPAAWQVAVRPPAHASHTWSPDAPSHQHSVGADAGHAVVGGFDGFVAAGTSQLQPQHEGSMYNGFDSFSAQLDSVTELASLSDGQEGESVRGVHEEDVCDFSEAFEGMLFDHVLAHSAAAASTHALP